MNIPVCVYTSIKGNSSYVPGGTWEFHYNTEVQQRDKNLAMEI